MAERAGIPRVSLRDLVQEIRGDAFDFRVQMHPVMVATGSGSTAEMAALSCIVAALRPKRILEFGTFNGLSTWHLVTNAPDAVVTTVDLPPEVSVAGSTDSGLQKGKTREFLPPSSNLRVVEIDSRAWTPDVEDIDLCFIDAGHSYECARNDTEKALKVMSRRGVVVWHDAAWHRDGYGVNRYLRELMADGLAIRIVRPGGNDYSGLAVCTEL